MKKKIIVTGIAAVALVAALQTSSVFASAPVKETPSSSVITAPTKELSSDNTNTDTVCNYCGKDCSFIDEDGDGICDNYKNHGTNGANAGKGVVDESGDGICDNYVSGRHGACGWGGGHGHSNYGNGQGRCHRR